MNQMLRRLALVYCAVAVVLAVVLRFSQLSNLPRSPYWEEVAVAYDAFSILKTGRDHHGNVLPFLALESFGDWKPSGYAYAQIPTIAVFGLTTFALRFPAAISGVLLVLLTGYISWRLNKNYLSVGFGMFFAAVSSWQIQFSRAGWEVMLATCLFGWGAVLITHSFSGTRMPKTTQIAGTVLLWLSAYTYHAMRLLVPLLIMVWVIEWCVSYFGQATGKNLMHKLVETATQMYFRFRIIAIISILFVLPFLLAFGSPQLQQRFSQTSIFSDVALIEQSNQAIVLADSSVSARIGNHRYVLFSRRILQNYLSHLSPAFLFVSGDANPRHSTGFGGQLYVLDILLLFVGLGLMWQLWLDKKKQLWVLLVFCLVLLTPVPASLTQATPHALRTLPMSIGFLVVSAAGANSLVHRFSFRSKRVSLIISVCLLTFLYGLQPLGWWLHYSRVYPVVAAAEWQYGYQELFADLELFESEYPNTQFFISREYGRPLMYLWFFRQTDPQNVQAESEIAPKDQGELLQFGRYHAIRSKEEISNFPAIVAASAETLTTFGLQNERILDVILDPSGREVWRIVYVPQR